MCGIETFLNTYWGGAIAGPAVDSAEHQDVISIPGIFIYDPGIKARLLKVIVDDVHVLLRVAAPKLSHKGGKIDLGLVEVFSISAQIERPSE